MSRHGNEGSRMGAAVLALGMASAPMTSLQGPSGVPNEPFASVRSMNSAPVTPQSAPIPLREEKRMRGLGQRVRENVLRSLNKNPGAANEGKVRGGKFTADDDGYQYSARDIATSRSMSRSRNSRGETEFDGEQNEAQFYPSNDLGVSVRQELGNGEDLYGIDERRLSNRVSAAVNKVLDPFYVPPKTRAEMDTEEGAVNDSVNSSLALQGSLQFEPIDKTQKEIPLAKEQEAALTEKLLATFVEGTHFKIEENENAPIKQPFYFNHKDKVQSKMKISITPKGAYAIDDFLALIAPKNNLCSLNLKTEEFIKANLEAFRAKGNEVRIQKLIQAQLSQALNGRDKTRSIERRQARRTPAETYGLDVAELQTLRAAESTPAVTVKETPFRKVSKSRLHAVNLELAKQYQRPEARTGFNAEEELAKAEAFSAPLASDMPEPTEHASQSSKAQANYEQA